MRVVFDMETLDPDDFVTLLLLLGHPDVDLAAVTISPGSREQVGWVRRAFEWFGVDLPIGVRDLDPTKPAVSGWHEKAYGPAEPCDEARPAAEVLREHCDQNTTLLTGAPLHNIGAVLDEPSFSVGRWVCQGGFAGEGVVPPDRQLEKFRGLATCPTYNLNGKPKVSLRALADERMGEVMLVSKNVCHAVVYDSALHAEVKEVMAGRVHLERIHQGMDVYLQGPERDEGVETETVRLILDDDTRQTIARDEALQMGAQSGQHLIAVRSEGDPRLCRIGTWTEDGQATWGKALHDPFAACCAINPAIADWAEVEPFRAKGEWGSRPSPGSRVRITTGWERDAFVTEFLL